MLTIRECLENNHTESPVHVVIAERQTAGKGRRNRPWVSLNGNIHLSIAFPCKGLCPGETMMDASVLIRRVLGRFSLISLQLVMKKTETASINTQYVA